ncbi:MAG: hypothetical protein ACRDL8_07735, partial [Solirubrobacteraceae bacterium]
MANVSYLRASDTERSSWRRRRGQGASPQRHGRGRWVLAAFVVAIVAVLVAAAVVLATAKASLSADQNGIARVDLPFGAGTIESVSVVTGPDSRTVPVKLTGDPVIVPKQLVPAGSRLSI